MDIKTHWVSLQLGCNSGRTSYPKRLSHEPAVPRCVASGDRKLLCIFYGNLKTDDGSNHQHEWMVITCYNHEFNNHQLNCNDGYNML